MVLWDARALLLIVIWSEFRGSLGTNTAQTETILQPDGKSESICAPYFEYDFSSGGCLPELDLDAPSCTSCVNGKCVGFEECVCNDGFKHSEEGCLPVCSKPCINGFCSAPNNCTCNEKYQMTEDGCKPICSKPCDNGFCVAPDNCTCNDNYQMTEDGCKPVCAIPCINGFCSAPNNCTCDEGYLKNELNHNLCYKPCKIPCINGTCDLHGNCTCSSDYTLNEETMTCTPIKLISCLECNGNCTDDKQCQCADGRRCLMEAPSHPPEGLTTKMASLDLTLISVGGTCLLLFILVVVVMQQIWRKRHKYGTKPALDQPGYGSVIYTLPHTLIHPRVNDIEDNEGSGEEDNTNNTLLKTETVLP